MKPEQRRGGSAYNKFMRRTKWNVSIRRLLFGPQNAVLRSQIAEDKLDAAQTAEAHNARRAMWREEKLQWMAYARALRQQVRDHGGTPIAGPTMGLSPSDFTPPLPSVKKKHPGDE